MRTQSIVTLLGSTLLMILPQIPSLSESATDAHWKFEKRSVGRIVTGTPFEGPIDRQETNPNSTLALDNPLQDSARPDLRITRARLSVGESVTDDFNRADSSAPGSQWTVTQGQGDIAGNQWRPSASNTKMHYSGRTFPNEQYSQARQYKNATESGHWRGLTCRVNGKDANAKGYVLYMREPEHGIPEVRFGHFYNSDWGAYLDTSPRLIDYKMGDIWRFEVIGQDTGIELKAYLNGALVYSLPYKDFTSPAIYNSGHPGMYNYTADGAYQDDWEGGGIGGVKGEGQNNIK